MNVLELLQKMKAVCPIPSLVTVGWQSEGCVRLMWRYDVTHIDNSVKEHMVASILHRAELNSPKAVGTDLEEAGRKIRETLMEDLK